MGRRSIAARFLEVAPQRLYRRQRRQRRGLRAQDARTESDRLEIRAIARARFPAATGRPPGRPAAVMRVTAARVPLAIGPPRATAAGALRRCGGATSICASHSGRSEQRQTLPARDCGRIARMQRITRLLPVLHAALRAFVLEFDDAALGRDGLDGGHAEFHGLLQGDVHAIAAATVPAPARHAAGDSRSTSTMRTGLDRDIAAFDARDARLEFAAEAVEQHDGLTDAESQHAHRMMRGIRLQARLPSRCRACRWTVKAGPRLGLVVFCLSLYPC